jgi:hypothetical protein
MNELDPIWKTAQKTQDPEIDDFTPNELISELEYHLRNPESGRPLLIWGAPGIGKTSIIKSFGLENKGIPVIEIILSLMEPTDVAGLPGIEQDEKDDRIKRSINYLPKVWPTDNKTGGILFLDEINRAHPSVQAAMLKVIFDREIAGANYKIPSKWLIVAAANRQEDEPGGSIKPMSFALANRFAQINLISDPSNWVEWARNKNLDDDVVSFVELMQEYFYIPPESISTLDTTMGVTPRSWDYAAREYAERKKMSPNGVLSEREINKIFNKHVGKKISSIVTDFIETTKIWPIERISRIFSDPKNLDLALPVLDSGNYDLRKSYAVMYMTSKYKNGTTISKEEFINFIGYLINLDSGEIAMSGLNLIKRTHPEVKDYLSNIDMEKYVTPFVSKYRNFMREV